MYICIACSTFYEQPLVELNNSPGTHLFESTMPQTLALPFIKVKVKSVLRLSLSQQPDPRKKPMSHKCSMLTYILCKEF